MDRRWNRRVLARVAALAVALAALYCGAPNVWAKQAGKPAAAPPQHAPLGFEDTPYLPGQKWRVHDIKRPHPPVITPGTPGPQERPGQPPSDAVVLFDGKDLSNWAGEHGRKAAWKVENGYMEAVPGAGSILSKQKFGDSQLHVEWAAPAKVTGASQDRGNSGVIIMGRYEIQVLDSYENVTYADGQAAAIYGQFPPLVNASRKPGDWQTYDIIFEAPRFEGQKLVKPAFVTVFHNGVAVHHHQEIIGAVRYREVATYAPHGPEEPLLLQEHGNPIRYRNIWFRRLDQ